MQCIIAAGYRFVRFLGFPRRRFRGNNAKIQRRYEGRWSMDETSPSKEGMHGLAAALADMKFLSLGIAIDSWITRTTFKPDLRAEPIKKTHGAICHQ